LNARKIIILTALFVPLAAVLTPAKSQNITQTDFAREARQADQFMNESHQDAAKRILLVLIRTPYAGVHEYVQLSYAYLNSLPGKTDYVIAGRYARKAILLDPECGPAYAALATVAIEQNDFNGCIQLATRAFTCKKPDAHAIYLRARAYAGLHKYNEALADLEKWDKLISPTDKTQITVAMQGEILEKLGKTDEAVKRYKADMPYHPENAVKNVVRCLKKAKRYPEAISEATVLINRNPNDSDAYNLRASLRALAIDWKGAVEDYNRAIDLSPTSTYYRNRAKAYEALGMANLAKQDLADAEKSSF
jgi:tetratricopeptide (TPR) repeat protein